MKIQSDFIILNKTDVASCNTAGWTDVSLPGVARRLIVFCDATMLTLELDQYLARTNQRAVWIDTEYNSWEPVRIEDFLAEQATSIVRLLEKKKTYIAQLASNVRTLSGNNDEAIAIASWKSPADRIRGARLLVEKPPKEITQLVSNTSELTKRLTFVEEKFGTFANKEKLIPHLLAFRNVKNPTPGEASSNELKNATGEINRELTRHLKHLKESKTLSNVFPESLFDRLGCVVLLADFCNHKAEYGAALDLLEGFVDFDPEKRCIKIFEHLSFNFAGSLRDSWASLFGRDVSGLFLVVRLINVSIISRLDRAVDKFNYFANYRSSKPAPSDQKPLSELINAASTLYDELCNFNFVNPVDHFYFQSEMHALEGTLIRLVVSNCRLQRWRGLVPEREHFDILYNRWLDRYSSKIENGHKAGYAPSRLYGYVTDGIANKVMHDSMSPSGFSQRITPNVDQFSCWKFPFIAYSNLTLKLCDVAFYNGNFVKESNLEGICEVFEEAEREGWSYPVTLLPFMLKLCGCNVPDLDKHMSLIIEYYETDRTHSQMEWMIVRLKIGLILCYLKPTETALISRFGVPAEKMNRLCTNPSLTETIKEVFSIPY